MAGSFANGVKSTFKKRFYVLMSVNVHSLSELVVGLLPDVYQHVDQQLSEL